MSFCEWTPPGSRMGFVARDDVAFGDTRAARERAGRGR